MYSLLHKIEGKKREGHIKLIQFHVMILVKKLQSILDPYKQESLDLFEPELILRFISISSRASEGFNIKEEKLWASSI